MRRALTSTCEGATLAATLHPADGPIGVVIVTGGVQTRSGAHRGFVDLADKLAAAGHPVLRYDRRGVGDSDGADPGFRNSGPDIAAALAALRAACPNVTRVAGWGLCDGAAALALHPHGFDALMLANPWTLDCDASPEIPGRAAVASHYRARLLERSFWKKLLTGGINLRRATSGLSSLTKAEPETDTAKSMAASLAAFDGPVLILLAERDNSATTFAAAWYSPTFAEAREKLDAQVNTLRSADHSFSRPADAEAVADACIAFLNGTAGSSGRT